VIESSACIGVTLAVTASHAALATFVVYMVGVFALAAAANRLLRGRHFLSEYFLGSRQLGVWAFALTFAATSASGGSFTGFPSKIYAHGWILGLWIGSYIVVPLCAMGLLGKRLNQVARISGAITVPDVLRDRFRSPAFGLLAVSLIVFFMTFNLVAQFKAGSVILKTLLAGVDLFQRASTSVSRVAADIPWLADVDPQYLIALGVFGVTVVAYTTWGGFHAVVWTDVLQGVVMVLGVALMLPLALVEVGGLPRATRQMVDMVPPRAGTATLERTALPRSERIVPAGSWIVMPGHPARSPGTATPRGETHRVDSGSAASLPRVYRVLKTVVIPAGRTGVSDVPVLELKTPADIRRVLENDRAAVAFGVRIADFRVQPYAYGAEPGRKGVYVTGPGPHPTQADGFLPLSLAVSFFFMWAISGAGQPSSMVRLMAFRNTATLRRAIATVAIYYSLIYFPLVVIFCCARVLLPGLDGESDRIMPAMTVFLTENIGAGWLAGVLVAAPFAAVMSTVDSFLLMISSSLVRDIYQRNINPRISERWIRRLSYACTLLVGLGAMLGAINPPQFLQDIIVYTGSGLAACFLAPMVAALYWPRANAIGCMASMIAGFVGHLSLYLAGLVVHGDFFSPCLVFNLDPIVFGLIVSFLTVYLVSKSTPPAPDALTRLYFYRSREV